MINPTEIPEWYLMVQILGEIIVEEGPYTLDRCTDLVVETKKAIANMANGGLFVQRHGKLLPTMFITPSCEKFPI